MSAAPALQDRSVEDHRLAFRDAMARLGAAVTIVDADELAGAMTEQLASLFEEQPSGGSGRARLRA